MFTFNDGRVHESVEVFASATDWHALPLYQVSDTTEYAAAASAIISLKRQLSDKVEYKYKVDGEWVLLPGRPTERDNAGNINHVLTQEAWQVRHSSLNGSTAIEHEPASASGLLVFLIPGNPGIAGYYEAFVSELAVNLPGARIVAASLKGFDLEESNRSKRGAESEDVSEGEVVGEGEESEADQFSSHGHGPAGTYNLDDQVEYSTAALAVLIEKHTPTRVAVLGHSVGAWILQRVTVNISRRIDFVGLLTPTLLNIARSDRGVQFRRLTSVFGPRSASWYVSFTRWVPFSGTVWSFLINRILKSSEVPESARECSYELVQNPRVVRQLLTMAMEEMVRIGEGVETTDITGFWDRPEAIWAMFAESDHWVSAETRKALEDLAETKSNVTTITLSGVAHAFVLRQSEAVAGLVASQIAR